MLRALAARIQAHEEVDVGFQRCSLVGGWVVREAGHDGVEEFPGCAAEVRFGGFVGEFGHYGGAGEGVWVDVEGVDMV